MAKSSQFIAVFLLTLVLFHSQARAIDLQFPVACQLLQNCWITNHVDLNTSKNAVEDYMCGSKSYDNSPATHISLGARNAVEDFIPVVAAADGEVVLARHIGQECGTRVVINHGKGWHTSYCNLNPKTLLTEENKTVTKGQILGTIGMSGHTNWPRLSFVVSRNGMIFDPFSGRSKLEGCLPNAKPMWTAKANPLYEPANITNTGFTVGHLSNNDISSGERPSATQISTETPQLSLWTMMMNVKKGDEVEMKVYTPTGGILNETSFFIDQDKIFYPTYFSTTRKKARWDPGIYIGQITLTRRVQNGKITTGKRAMVQLIKQPYDP